MNEELRFTRWCDRCSVLFKTSGRYSRVCQKCKDESVKKKKLKKLFKVLTD